MRVDGQIQAFDGLASNIGDRLSVALTSRIRVIDSVLKLISLGSRPTRAVLQ
ncbi:hypothetical protein [Synechocystis sp. PCC 6803]|uniref:hypothetical protein n=1 Tax=Synechocystis sp. PCC 6803 TaxID=1148 RepID=UPI0002E3B89A|nr:hypothetical protein [Synechocystis sp. PCC 6803]